VADGGHARVRLRRRTTLRRHATPAATRRASVVAAAVVLAGAIAGAGCGAARSYVEPSGPLYETRHAPPPPESGSASERLRVVTFNIEFAIHVDRAIEVLQGTPELQGFDLLALQEMDAPGVERIARALGLNSFYAPGGVHPSTGRDHGCALLSPWPLVDCRKLLLPHGSRGTGLRWAAVGATLVRGPRRIRVYALHLPAPYAASGTSRREQVDVLLDDAAGWPDPVLIAGDLNSHGIGDAFVARGYLWLTRDVGPSVAVAGVLRFSFDHVFARGLPVSAAFSSGVVRDNRKASDHHPVWALVDLEGHLGT
jgi:endonuclease/exonuclease/phosphatase family metal-dependent hydrolase